MPDYEITQEQFEKMVEDATYLQDESEALQYVIDSIPFSDQPPGDYSVIQKLQLLDFLQVQYFRPVFEASVANSRNPKVEDISQFIDRFTTEEENQADIHKVLNKLSKHRAALINIFRNISLIDWEKVIYKNNIRISLFDFSLELVSLDRKILKEIADLVMVLQNNQGKRREIESHRQQQK